MSFVVAGRVIVSDGDIMMVAKYFTYWSKLHNNTVCLYS